MDSQDHSWIVNLVQSHALLLNYYEQSTGMKADDPTALDGYKFMKKTLEALDVGDCDSGGDYHSSAFGKHVDPETSGAKFCPACQVRKILKTYGLLNLDGSYIEYNKQDT
jgi:hypothetical protein